MMRFLLLVGGLFLFVLIPASASAQDSNGPPSDPNADSPSGTVYELPLERGRNDAAPRRQPGAQGTEDDGATTQAAPDGTPDGTDTSIRSENYFGSSSQVPGVDDPPEGGEALADAGGARGTGATAIDPSSAGITDTAPSHALIIPLLVLLVVVGGGSGLLAARARTR